MPARGATPPPPVALALDVALPPPSEDATPPPAADPPSATALVPDAPTGSAPETPVESPAVPAAPTTVAETPPAPPPPAAPRACETFGTSVEFVASPAEAYRWAKQNDKLVFLLHVSGNFEESGFT
jgi:hypothetical protein